VSVEITAMVPMGVLADSFGDNFRTPDGENPGPMIPVNALWSIAKEIALLVTVVEDTGTTYPDLGMHFLWLSRRMEAAAQIGADQIHDLQGQIRRLESQLAAKNDSEAAE